MWSPGPGPSTAPELTVHRQLEVLELHVLGSVSVVNRSWPDRSPERSILTDVDRYILFSEKIL